MADVLLFFLSCLGLALAQRIDDPRYWAFPEFFDIFSGDGKTKYECVDRGARCVFQRSDFDCLDEPCKVICNANCTCTIDATNEPCVEGISPAPTPRPVAAPSSNPVCPQVKAVQHCPELMQNRLPLGQEGLFDCYNFCGGEFVSACAEGSCGLTECDNHGEDGTVDGIVMGCTAEHLDIQLKPESKAAAAVVSVLALVVAFGVLL